MLDQLLGKSPDELSHIVKELGLTSFTAKQIAEWLYKHRITEIEQMSNLSKKAREILASKYEIGVSQHVRVSESMDGTKKYLFQTQTGHFIESAYIPDKDRATLCVSSQAGCKMGCLFCMTAKQGFQAHLSTAEILNQIRSLPEFETLSNVVYMGMGEPFDNLDAVLASLKVLTEPWGYAWSPKRITVSTVGILPSMIRFLEESNCHLAVSLHTPFEDERRHLMPVEQVYHLPQILETIRNFDFGKQRRISFEYILFKGVNDSPRHLKELVRLLGNIRCRVNLLRFHSIEGNPLQPCDENTMIWFRDSLTARGVMTTIRSSRGQDIEAACGLLSTKELVKKKN